MGMAALIVSAGVLISRILGQLREIIFASLLGATASTDEYVAAFAIPDFLNYLLAGGFLSITFIPIFARFLAEDDEEAGWEALSAIIRPIAVGIVGLVLIGWVAAPQVIELLFPRFSAEQIDNTVRFTRIVLPAQIFFVLGALFSAVQYTKGVFTIPTLAPIIYNLGIIIGGVGWAIVDEASPEGFVWGALSGALVGNFALQWWGARRVGMRLTLGIPWRHPVLKEYLLIAFPLMIGQSIVVLDETFMRVFGQFVSEGAATELNYARRTMLVPVGVIAQAAGVAAYPFLARLFAERRIVEMRDSVDRALRWVIILSMAATGLVAAMTVPIVRALFERGEFTAASTVGTAEALFFYEPTADLGWSADPQSSLLRSAGNVDSRGGGYRGDDCGGSFVRGLADQLWTARGRPCFDPGANGLHRNAGGGLVQRGRRLAASASPRKTGRAGGAVGGHRWPCRVWGCIRAGRPIRLHNHDVNRRNCGLGCNCPDREHGLRGRGAAGRLTSP